MTLTKAFDFWLPDFFTAGNLRAGSYCEYCKKFYLPTLWFYVLAFPWLLFCTVSYAIETRTRRITQLVIGALVLYTLPHTIIYGASRYHEPLTVLVIVFALPEASSQLSRAARLLSRDPLLGTGAL